MGGEARGLGAWPLAAHEEEEVADVQCVVLFVFILHEFILFGFFSYPVIKQNILYN